ncbi:MAG: VOC family protein [Candidatus Dormibacteraeota bacterium]|nr:VOC family protein [Candidatus Dormibacteraeota bacterium]
MEQRISLITLGVRDLSRARAFYEALGWGGAVQPDDEVVFFQAGGMILSLWRRDRLVEEAALEDGGGFGAVSLAHNVRSPAEVDALMARAMQAGARITRPARAMDWGGYSGTFVDPEGHPWEIAHNPGWPLAEDGSVSLQ